MGRFNLKNTLDFIVEANKGKHDGTFYTRGLKGCSDSMSGGVNSLVAAGVLGVLLLEVTLKITVTGVKKASVAILNRKKVKTYNETSLNSDQKREIIELHTENGILNADEEHEPDVIEEEL